MESAILQLAELADQGIVLDSTSSNQLFENCPGLFSLTTRTHTAFLRFHFQGVITSNRRIPLSPGFSVYRIVTAGQELNALQHILTIEERVRNDLTPTARRTANLAARVAGRRRNQLYDEWTAILAGAPEDDITFSPQRQVVLAFGFLIAAVQMRARDTVRPAWRPVDWLLRTPSRTNAFITTAVGTQAVYIVGGDGLGALATEIWEPCGIAGASLYALSRWLRRVRGVELATAERESADE
ncbi:hypothetical protein ACIPSJ_05190 [Streptomyces sp. NPDC090088]|uniref:hypothetical protein n=1 Tax=Streptomyces sp. NPDC090088 TaxID=3365944 RepID=UPI0038021528